MVGEDLSVRVRLATESLPESEVVWGEKRRFNPTAAVRFLARRVEGLPMVCVRHGVPATGVVPATINFVQVGSVRMPRTVGLELRKWAREIIPIPPWFRLPDTSAKLRADWPACAACIARFRWLRQLAFGVLLAGPPAIVALFLAAAVGVPHGVIVSLVVLCFPGWLPVGIGISGLMLMAANTDIKVEPIDERPFVVIRAHPRFADATRSERHAD
ncbi:hypothetical protein [Nocardia sp. NPDC058497]|uniref:hypothetical protein n=1 Tax=Nocardia sp. NPDC058497 TaxID=3346529 RepID=UPI003650F18A